jgi:hypothetical protein
MRYAVVIENAGSNFSAYVPDLPGCVATGATLAEVWGRRMRDELPGPDVGARAARLNR